MLKNTFERFYVQSNPLRVKAISNILGTNWLMKHFNNLTKEEIGGFRIGGLLLTSLFG
jgi:hypothetical protein